MNEKPTFVIGDVHGHYDRLQALLSQEAVSHIDCTVVQLGDLGHFGDSAPASDDLRCWQEARKGAVDIVLWGNHDRAVVSSLHEFYGYQSPGPEIRHMMKIMEMDGRLLMAYAAHGHLITHAGLHAQWKYQKLPDEGIRNDPYKIADYINSLVGKDEYIVEGGSLREAVDGNHAVFDAVGRTRGGASPYGGILWRDHREKLYRGFPQVFGHSASANVRQDEDSWNIDIGSKGGAPGHPGNQLAGLWLPEMRVAEVHL